MDKIRRNLWMLWRDERAISSVEYAMLLAFVGASIIAAADSLSNAVSNEFLETAFVLDGDGGGGGDGGGDGCGNDGGGDGTGGDGGSGQGGDNTC